MSLIWDSSEVRPAGYGLACEQFYPTHEEWKQMQAMYPRGTDTQVFAEKVNHAQRGSNWRVYVTAASALVFWVSCWLVGGNLDAWTR